MTSFDGFDDFADQLDELADEFGEMADNAAELEGENEVSFDELFTDEFMRQHSEVNSIEEFFEESQWDVSSEEDFEAIPEDEFDEYIDSHTEFDSWGEMQRAAVEDWTARQIGF